MTVFLFDKSFEGLLTVVFEAYSRHIFPDLLLEEGETLPLFHDGVISVPTDETKAARVWHGLQNKLSASALQAVAECWLAEEPETPMLLFRYVCKVIDSPRSIETNFADQVILDFSRMWKRVDWERTRLVQFIRFQKTADGIYFAAVGPQKNALPLVVPHFRDRFSDQPWIIYDIRRSYGFYHNLTEVTQITLDNASLASDGRLPHEMLAEDEDLYQELWRTYFRSICIKERINPRKHRQDMPERYWKYLTEKQ